MAVEQLSPDRLAVLQALDPTYARVGGLAGVTAAPAGYTSFARSVLLPAGSDLRELGHQLFDWQVQRRAGFRVTASSARVELDAVADLTLGVGCLVVRAPVRIVSVVDEPTRRGFSYGTLPGHPVSGEESFLLESDATGAVTLTVGAFSKPAGLLARVVGPLGRAAQRLMAGRYLRAFDRTSRRER